MSKTRVKKKVLVAMSGGVDSSVAAALLLREGYKVTGAFMRQWSDNTPPPRLSREAGHPPSYEEGIKTVCSWKKDRRDALRAAAHLGIPLITLDFEKEYKQWVMDYMFCEYQAGRTPNPDVWCNKYIKFGVWLEKARELGFAYLATGHYARLKWQVASGKYLKKHTHNLSLATCHLHQAKDKNKDQTYFLHQLTQAQLAHTLFPIDGYLKSEVRKLARKFKLPTAERAESMGICFVGEVPMKDFLQQRIKPRPGKIVTTTGEVIGGHEGLAFYTVGQRHLSSKHQNIKTLKHCDSKPLYVVDKRFETNELVVGHEDDPALYRKEVIVGEVNWVSGHAPEFPLHCRVRLRHRQPLQVCNIKTLKHKNIKTILVEFAKPQRAVTPGQFAVFYKKGECLGGGVIQ